MRKIEFLFFTADEVPEKGVGDEVPDELLG